MKKLIIIFVFSLALGSIAEAKMTLLPDNNYLVDQHVESGWNVFTCFLPSYIQPDSEIKQWDITVLWVYVPQLKKYYQLYPENELDDAPVEIGRQINEAQLLSSSCWVYSAKSGNIKYKTAEPLLKLSQRKMYRGWNFVTLSPEFKFTPLSNFQGSCSINKIAIYQHNKWEVGTPENMPDGNRPWTSLIFADSDSDIGRGALMSVENDCVFGDPKPQVVQPPSLPL